MKKYEGRLLAVDDQQAALDIIQRVADMKGLSFTEVLIPPILDPNQWIAVGPEQKDLVVLDVSFKYAKDPKKLEYADIDLAAPDIQVEFDLSKGLGNEIRDGMTEHNPPVDFTGLDVLKYLAKWRKEGQLEGLARVLLNTTLRTSFDSPDILNIPGYNQGGFDVYALRRESIPPAQRVKGAPTLDVDSYLVSLAGIVERIYDGIETPINGKRIARR